ncbi:sensor histidine kinase [Actinomadura harenae]|uniref:Oxygen sensor histidine kinase NreB n=1 Tax=Actinomadura harenae TaxID=2483351 RepID=A0A3M2LZL6_9ACTN|nr:sensor histidine kinase [Actinomadura harenae]RMI42909.1 sensor histidine kinase [Actinomadura harenae]
MNPAAHTPTPRALEWCLHLLAVALLALAPVRALSNGEPHASLIFVVAVICAAVYAAGPLTPRVRRSRRAAAVWLAALSAAWLVLLVLTADGVWVAFPLYFLHLHLLPRRVGLAATAATAAAAITAVAAHNHQFTPAVAIGPTLGAAVAVAVVWGYQALYRESEQRRRLIEELTATRADLAAVQHTAGVLEERQRLAQEIHDTLAQGLSSIQLLLRAAERSLPRPASRSATAPGDTSAGTSYGSSADDSLDKVARYVDQARQTAMDNLAEARRFVAALMPPSLDDVSLAGALERLCAATSARHPLTARFHLTGSPLPLPTAYEVALLRVAQSALANTVQHAEAGSVDVTLSFLGDHVALDIVDDGIGFDPALPTATAVSGPSRPPSASSTTPIGGSGFGLAAMRARARALGGTLTVESSPGLGAALAVQLPLPQAPESQPAPRETGRPSEGSQDDPDTDPGWGRTRD